MQSISFHISAIILYFIQFSIGESRVPSLTDISNINDPVLNEVFASSAFNTPRDDEPVPHLNRPQPMATSTNAFQTARPTNTFTHPQGEIPIHHPDSLGAPMSSAQPDSSLSQLVTTGANVFATGANAFYRGAASVGQAFGINDYNYNIPLVNQAAAFFG
ncbi:unnamed protein product [Auanema sp. JU1783]|nr:unnamed protein product [Auanema sp. JU1783]